MVTRRDAVANIAMRNAVMSSSINAATAHRTHRLRARTATPDRRRRRRGRAPWRRGRRRGSRRWRRAERWATRRATRRRARRRIPPVAERFGDPLGARRSPERLPSTRAHDVPPAPATSIAATPQSSSRAAVDGAIPDPTLFAITGTSRPAHSAASSARAPEIGVTAPLDRFLQRVEVKIQPVRSERVDQPSRVIDADAVIQLHRAEVGEQCDARGDRAHVEGRAQRLILEHRSTAAQREGDPRRLGAAGEPRLISAARAVPPVIDEIRSGARSGSPRTRCRRRRRRARSPAAPRAVTAPPANRASAARRHRHPGRRRGVAICAARSIRHGRREGVRAATGDHLPDGDWSTGLRRASGTAGRAVGAALLRLAGSKDLEVAELAAAADLDAAQLGRVIAGEERLASRCAGAAGARTGACARSPFCRRPDPRPARLCRGLDPLYFLPTARSVRRPDLHARDQSPDAVPEGDMTKRKPVLKGWPTIRSSTPSASSSSSSLPPSSCRASAGGSL